MRRRSGSSLGTIIQEEFLFIFFLFYLVAAHAYTQEMLPIDEVNRSKGMRYRGQSIVKSTKQLYDKKHTDAHPQGVTPVAQSCACPPGDQEVASSKHRTGYILSLRGIMKSFL